MTTQEAYEQYKATRLFTLQRARIDLEWEVERKEKELAELRERRAKAVQERAGHAAAHPEEEALYEAWVAAEEADATSQLA